MDNNHSLLPDLRVFVLVVEQGSFTRAARLLNMSTSAASRSVRRLEEAIGLQLLNRTTRRVGLTDLGSELHERCQSGLRQLQQAITEVKGNRTQAQGLLRVTSSLTFGRNFVVPAVNDFRVLYPEIEVDLSLTDDVVELVDSGMDIAVRGGMPRDGRLISRKLAPLPLYVCASPAFLRRHRRPNRIEDLQSHECIRFRFRSSGAELAWEFVRNRSRVALDVRGRLCFDDIEAVRDAAIAGLGFAQLPGYVAVKPIREGALVPLLLEYLDISRLFAVTYLNRSERQPLRDKLFVDHLSARLGDATPFMLSAEEVRRFGGAES
jgi:DNA-binding transcriptional LysR family regulator